MNLPNPASSVDENSLAAIALAPAHVASSDGGASLSFDGVGADPYRGRQQSAWLWLADAHVGLRRGVTR